jgi:hypothetical protein
MDHFKILIVQLQMCPYQALSTILLLRKPNLARWSPEVILKIDTINFLNFVTILSEDMNE